MAKLSVHGAEVGRIEFNTSAKAYMADGVVLKNDGFGWKVYAKLKAGIPAQQAYESLATKQREFIAARPALAAYRKGLHELAGLSKRWKLHAAVQAMPDDADGLWAEACDGYSDNVSADVSEVARLCALYNAAMREMQAFGSKLD